MTRRIICAFIVVMGVLTNGVRAVEPDYPLSFDPKEIDCGIVYDTSKSQSFTVQYTNTSKNAVTISKFVASCGCTKLTFTKPNLAPGESGQLSLTINPFGKQNAFIVTIVAKGATRDDILGGLRAVGFVSQIAKLAPSLQVFRVPSAATALKLETKLFLDKNIGDWTLAPVAIDDPNFQIVSSSFTPVTGAGETREIDSSVELKCTNAAVKLPARAKINYVFTSEEAKRKGQRSEFNLWQDLLILPDSPVSCFPSTVNLLFLEGDQTLKKVVTIINPSKSPLGVSSTIAALRLALQDPGQGTSRLTIELDSAAAAHSLDGKIQITSASGEPLATIPVAITQLNLSH